MLDDQNLLRKFHLLLSFFRQAARVASSFSTLQLLSFPWQSSSQLYNPLFSLSGCMSFHSFASSDEVGQVVLMLRAVEAGTSQPLGLRGSFGCIHAGSHLWTDVGKGYVLLAASRFH